MTVMIVLAGLLACQVGFVLHVLWCFPFDAATGSSVVTCASSGIRRARHGLADRPIQEFNRLSQDIGRMAGVIKWIANSN